MNSKVRARLNNWTIGHCIEDKPCTISLFGEVYGHPRFPDGKAIITSQIISVDLIQKIAETQFTFYDLGDACEAVYDRYKELIQTPTEPDNEDQQSSSQPNSKV